MISEAEMVSTVTVLTLGIVGCQQSSYADDPSRRQDAIQTVSWLLRSFAANVCSSYCPGAPRRLEAGRVVEHALNSLKPQLTFAEFSSVSGDLAAYIHDCGRTA